MARMDMGLIWDVIKAVGIGNILIPINLFVVLKPVVVHIDLYRDMVKQRDVALEKAEEAQRRADHAQEAALTNVERMGRFLQESGKRRA